MLKSVGSVGGVGKKSIAGSGGAAPGARYSANTSGPRTGNGASATFENASLPTTIVNGGFGSPFSSGPSR